MATARKNRNALVIGLGISGAAAALFLSRRGYDVTVVDDADTPLLQERAHSLVGEGIDVLLGGKPYSVVPELVVPSPGVPASKWEQFRDRKIPVQGEVEIGCSEINVPIIAVTGTNGKSTVVTHIAKGLSRNGIRSVAIGNLGTPVTEWVDHGEEVDCVVLEVSSYQLETIEQFHPKIAVILNVAPDHLGHHGSMESYIAAKARIAMNQTIDDALVLHKDLVAHTLLQKTRSRLYWYGRDLAPSLDGLSLGGNTVTWRGEGPEWSSSITPQGLFPHEVDNLLACVAVLRLMGVDGDSALRLFEDYERLPHRIETVGEINGARYVNDSKATNAHAAIASLAAFSDPLIWLVGGEGKGEDLSDLARAASESNLKSAICFGRDGRIFASALEPVAKVRIRPTLREAFDLSTEIASPGDVVLLAPAGASFDEFRSFEDRGDQFRSWVESHQGVRS